MGGRHLTNIVMPKFSPDCPFAMRLKYERERIKITQSEAVALLGDISFEAYSKWERGLSTPAEITQEGALMRLARQKPKAKK